MVPADSQGNLWICNTDVESEWSLTETEEASKRNVRKIIFHHFEEILLSSIGPHNTAILRSEPDSQFKAYLEDLGIKLPEILVVHGNEETPWMPTARLVLEDPSLLSELASRVRSGRATILESFGISRIIENIANHTNLTLPYAGSETAALISRKSFNRHLALKLGLPVPDGEVCENIEDIPRAVHAIQSRGGGCPVVIKPDLGASGRGQYLIRDKGDFENVFNVIDPGELKSHETTHIIERLITSIERGDLETPKTTYVVERWYPKATTLTYEFHINRDGHVSTAFHPRKALMDKYGKDYGYVYPAKIENKFLNEIRSASNVLATELWEEYNYHGPVRCDALLLSNGHLFPVLELNARHSFFYFIDLLHNKLSDQPVGLFCWFFFRTIKNLKFERFVDKFIGKDLMFSLQKKEGVVVPIWSTVKGVENIKHFDDEYSLRRLFVFIISTSCSRAINTADAIRRKLNNGFR